MTVAVAAGMTVAKNRFRLRPVSALLLVAGFGAMTWGIATRWQIAGRIPASDMYESMLFLGWGVGFFGLVGLFLGQRLLVANAAGLGAVAMMLADLLPVDPFIHPMAPVLSGTPWLAIHVPIIVVSGDTDPRTPERLSALGANAFFPKPYSPAEVRLKLEQLLDANPPDCPT